MISFCAYVSSIRLKPIMQVSKKLRAGLLLKISNPVIGA
jgi:hypothetical protein